MNTKLKIPAKIKVGFQKRSDTYTGKLAYVISIGNSKKEDPKSWVGWRDEAIDPEEYDNIPTMGFVLNRDVGGVQRGRYDWNARREKVRVFDPRNFEFEITVENVLLILQECSSIKGKGLEGEFIYSWSGSQLVLLPICSQEYKTAVEFIDLGNQKINKVDIIPGCTYLTKDKVNVMYMGRMPWFDKVSEYMNYRGDKCLRGQKKHIFINMDYKFKDEETNSGGIWARGRYIVESGFTSLAKRTSETPIAQFADEYEKLMETNFVSIPNSIFTKVCSSDNMSSNNYGNYYYNEYHGIEDDGKILWCVISQYKDNSYYLRNIKAEDRRYDIESIDSISIKDGGFLNTDYRGFKKSKLTAEEVRALIKDVYIKCENGSEYKFRT